MASVNAQKTELTTAVLTYQEYEKAAARQDLTNMKPILVKAKTKIEEAYTKQEANKSLKQKDVAKMYYHRAMIYMNYAGLSMFDEDVKNEIEADEEKFETIIKTSFEQCFKEDIRDEWKNKAHSFAKMQRAQTVNMGIELYNKKDYSNALMMFQGGAELYDLMGMVDSVSLYYGALSANNTKDYEVAKEYLRKCVEVGYNAENSNLQLINTLRLSEAPEEEIVKTIKSAREAYPNDYPLLIEELNYYLTTGNNAEAEKNLKVAIEKNPNDHVLLFTIGNVYDKQGDFNKAEENYKKAISVKEDYIDAQYSLGALYINKSTEMKKAAGDEKEMSKADKMYEEANATMKLAIAPLERSYSIDPADKDAKSILNVLKQIYVQFEMMDDYNRVKALIEAE